MAKAGKLSITKRLELMQEMTAHSRKQKQITKLITTPWLKTLGFQIPGAQLMVIQ